MEDDGAAETPAAPPSVPVPSLCLREGVPRVLRAGVFFLDGVLLRPLDGVRGSRLALLVFLRGVLEGDDISCLTLH